MPRRVRDVPRGRRLGNAEPDLHDRVLRDRDRRVVVPLEPVRLVAQGRTRGLRSVGRADARVGYHLATAGAQLRFAPADPLRTPGLGHASRRVAARQSRGADA